MKVKQRRSKLPLNWKEDCFGKKRVTVMTVGFYFLCGKVALNLNEFVWSL